LPMLLLLLLSAALTNLQSPDEKFKNCESKPTATKSNSFQFVPSRSQWSGNSGVPEKV
jgi:hypothetical protein